MKRGLLDIDFGVFSYWFLLALGTLIKCALCMACGLLAHLSGLSHLTAAGWDPLSQRHNAYNLIMWSSIAVLLCTCMRTLSRQILLRDVASGMV